MSKKKENDEPEKKDWRFYEELGVPVQSFYLFSHAARVFSSVHGVDPKSVDPVSMTERLCDEWIEQHPSLVQERLLGKIKESVKPPPVVPLGARAPTMQQSPAICGHQSDPDPNGTRHICVEPQGHRDKHGDQEWYWFLTDFKPTRRTL